MFELLALSHLSPQPRLKHHRGQRQGLELAGVPERITWNEDMRSILSDSRVSPGRESPDVDIAVDGVVPK